MRDAYIPSLDGLRWPEIVPGVFGSHEVSHVLIVMASCFFHVFVVRHVLPREDAAPVSASSSEPLRVAS